LPTSGGGNLTKEEYFGGDQQTLGTGELCSLALPANQYRIDHTWQYGAGNLSQYYDAAGNALSFKSLDTDIDLSSGLVKKSRDTSLIGTSYEYDTLGRLTAVKPDTGHDGWTIYTYSRSLGASSPAQVQVSRQPNGGGTALAESIIKYDSFGRVWQEHTKMPDGTWSIRQTSYNPLHWKTQVTEQGNTAKKTEYLNYDPFGRPATIRPPDGSTHDVALSYLGVRKVSRTSKVGNTITGSTRFHDQRSARDHTGILRPPGPALPSERAGGVERQRCHHDLLLRCRKPLEPGTAGGRSRDAKPLLHV
jgi:hypothetical protein